VSTSLGAFASPPQPQRPISPPASYGVPTAGGEMMPWSFVTDQLESAHNYWIVTVGSGERPHSAPVWGAFVADDLFFETSPTTRKGRNLARNPAVVVHTESADEVVIVEGLAAPSHRAPRNVERLVQAFRAKYDGYEPDPDEWGTGSLYRVTPTVIFAWRDMPTATCWRFERRSERSGAQRAP
jgi:nitroimidazol reductase NimA-like FMN-containing flavoprotein (pyridoxamine 5'-phosphate oxidase superfamily)